jgi:two-component system, sensor histidine kinase PdtaS
MKRFPFFIMVLLIPASAISQGLIPDAQTDDSLQINSWLSQGEKLLNTQFAESQRLAQKSLSLAEKKGYKYGIARSSYLLGLQAFINRDRTRSMDLLTRSRDLFKEKGEEYYLGRVMKVMGDVYSAGSYFRQAFDHYRDAVVLLRKTNQLRENSQAQEAIANLSLEFGYPRNAISAFKRLLILKNSLNDKPGIITTMSKLSKLYLTLKQYDSALFFTREIQRIAESDQEILAEALIDELVIHSFQGNYEAAGVARKQAEQLTGNIQNIVLTIRMLTGISVYYTAQLNKTEARRYFDSAAAKIEKVRGTELAVSGLAILADMSSQQGDYKTAYSMLLLMDKYKDIFRNNNMERISAEIKNTAEADMDAKEIEFLNRENNLKAGKLRNETLLRMALIRQNLLIDSSLEQQKLLTAIKERESSLREDQLQQEKELRLSLSRENELKQEHLNEERNSKWMLWMGIAGLALSGAIIFAQYRRQIRKNAIIRKQSGELEVLNKEIHHRVKNNLQRVQSMAFIHQNLYQGHSVNSVNMNEYIRMLSNHLFQTYNIRSDKIRLYTSIEELNLHTDTAIPLGMILNELISNALKYAFTGREEGDIRVTMKRTDNELLLQVKDNGKGLPEGFSPDTVSSFGYEIIKAFAQKMKARINIDGSQGTDVRIIISKFKTIG